MTEIVCIKNSPLLSDLHQANVTNTLAVILELSTQRRRQFNQGV